jgi:short-subunit dehydrogenase
MRDWAGRRYWLLGADTPLGAALALKLSRAGVELVLSGRDQGRLEDLMVSLPGRSSYIPLDITRRDRLDGVAIELGTVDGMVYASDLNVASGLDGPPGASARMVSDTLLGLCHALDLVLPGLRERGGHVVMLDSLASITGLPGQAGHCAAKAGVRVLAEALRAEAPGGRVSVQLVTLCGADVATAAGGIFEHMGTTRFRRSVPAAAGLLVRAAHLLPGWLMRPAIATLTKRAQD